MKSNPYQNFLFLYAVSHLLRKKPTSSQRYLGITRFNFRNSHNVFRFLLHATQIRDSSRVVCNYVVNMSKLFDIFSREVATFEVYEDKIPLMPLKSSQAMCHSSFHWYRLSHLKVTVAKPPQEPCTLSFANVVLVERAVTWCARNNFFCKVWNIWQKQNLLQMHPKQTASTSLLHFCEYSAFILLNSYFSASARLL